MRREWRGCACVTSRHVYLPLPLRLAPPSVLSEFCVKFSLVLL